MVRQNSKFIITTTFILILTYIVIASGTEWVPNDAVGSVGSSPNLLNPSTIGEVGINNISGTAYNLTIALDKDGTFNNGNISNISVMWQLRSNNSFMANLTFNTIEGQAFFGGPGIASGMVRGCGAADAGWGCTNRTFWNLTFATTNIPDGRYNLTIQIYNLTQGLATLNVTNSSFATNVTVDNTPPIINNLSLNVTNGTNFTGAGWIGVGVLARDVTTYIRNITFVLINIYNNTQYNFTGNDTGVANTINRTIDFSTIVEGLYDIRVFANDTLNNVNNTERNVSFRVDKTPPNVTATSSDGKQDRNFTTTVTDIITLNVTLNDSVTAISLANFSFELNGTVFNRSASVTEGRFNLSINTSQLSQGRHTIRVIARDSLSNTNLSQTFQIRVDGTVPQLNNLSMNITNSTNYTRSGAIALSVNANDSITVPNNVIFEIESITNGTRYNVTLAAPSWGDGPLGLWIHNLTLSTFTDGLYQVRVYANDTLNNVNQTISQINNSFRIDGTAPNVTYHSMNVSNNTNFTRSGAIRFNVSAADAITSVLDRVHFEIINMMNGTMYNLTTAMRDVNGFQSVNLTLSDQSDGLYEVRLYVNDTLGNINTSYRNLSYRVDGTAPNISYMSLNVSNGTNFSGSDAVRINISIIDSVTSAKDNVTFQLISLYNGSTYNFSTNSYMTLGSFAFWHRNISLSGVDDGMYDIRIYANDTLGNVNSSWRNLTLRIDRAPPNVTNVSWHNVSNFANLSIGLSEGMVNLTTYVNDSTTHVENVIFGINSSNGTQFNVTANASSKTSQFWYANVNLSLLTEGLHGVTIYANDDQSNRNATEAKIIRLDRTAPSITVSCSPASPTVGQTVTCDCTGTDTGSQIKTSAQFTSGGTSESTTASSVGSFTSSTCRATDFADNIGEATGSWTVVASSSSGGSAGGGGSSGGSSSSSSSASTSTSDSSSSSSSSEGASSSGATGAATSGTDGSSSSESSSSSSSTAAAAGGESVTSSAGKGALAGKAIALGKTFKDNSAIIVTLLVVVVVISLGIYLSYRKRSGSSGTSKKNW